MPEDLKLSQIGSSQLLPPFRGLHSPGVRKLSNYFCLLIREIVYLRDLSLALDGDTTICTVSHGNLSCITRSSYDSDLKWIIIALIRLVLPLPSRDGDRIERNDNTGL